MSASRISGLDLPHLADLLRASLTCLVINGIGDSQILALVDRGALEIIRVPDLRLEYAHRVVPYPIGVQWEWLPAVPMIRSRLSMVGSSKGLLLPTSMLLPERLQKRHESSRQPQRSALASCRGWCQKH